MIDLLYITKNRLEFTKASFAALAANTDWTLISKFWVYDDGSVDDTRRCMDELYSELHVRYGVRVHQVYTQMGSPAAIMREFALHSDVSPLFAKIDNDVIVPPGWLNACCDVMITHPELDLLGIEPPESRTPHYTGGRKSPHPEYDIQIQLFGPMMRGQTQLHGYAPCDSIGGIGLMRTSIFKRFKGLMPHSIYGGFTEFQLNNPAMKKGWVTPPLPVFLLDRLPSSAYDGHFRRLSNEYIAKGWQRAWSGYDSANPFWEWWKPEPILAEIVK